jgi:hypothetical protein
MSRVFPVLAIVPISALCAIVCASGGVFTGAAPEAFLKKS